MAERSCAQEVESLNPMWTKCYIVLKRFTTVSTPAQVAVLIGVGDGGEAIQIYSGKFEMIRALKLGEDLF